MKKAIWLEKSLVFEMDLERKFLQLTEKHAELQLEYTKALEANDSLTWQLNEQLEKNEALKAEKESLSAALANDKSCIKELQRSKDVLATELEELTKNLFEEASGMVAKEAKRRNAIQIQQDALQIELEIARDLIATQQEELQRYRQLLLNIDSAKPLSGEILRDPPEYESICGTLDQYCQHYSLEQENIVHSQLVQRIRDSVDPFLFCLFQSFLQNPVEMSDKFLKRMYQCDIESTLRGSHKILKLSERRIFHSLVKGSCNIELCSESWLNDQYFYYENGLSSPVSSATHSILNLYYSFVGASTEEIATVAKSPSPTRISSTTSFSDEEVGTETDVEKESSKIVNYMCGMCGKGYTGKHVKYRFKLHQSELWLPLDTFCRERFVAVGNFVTFVQNIKKGFYGTSIEPFYLYLKLLQHRREMFFAKCSGSLFFRTNDLVYVWQRKNEQQSVE